jgi:hypothetical protein
MAFKCTIIATKPSDAEFFGVAHPDKLAEIAAYWRSQPGFIEGSWGVDPTDPNKYITEHSWNNRNSWRTAADQSVNVEVIREVIVYGLEHNITVEKDFKVI